MNYNKVVLTGNLTRDPELVTGAKGNVYVRSRMAVNHRYIDRDNNKQERTTFVDVSFFGKQAEVFSRYLKKGDPVLCEGRLEMHEWQADDGAKRSKLSIFGEGFRFLPRRNDGTRGEVMPLDD